MLAFVKSRYKIFLFLFYSIKFNWSTFQIKFLSELNSEHETAAIWSVQRKKHKRKQSIIPNNKNKFIYKMRIFVQFSRFYLLILTAEEEKN